MNATHTTRRSILSPSYLNRCRKTYGAAEFAPGQQVRQRTWSVSPAGDGEPQIGKRIGRVVAVHAATDEVEVVGLGYRNGNLYDAFELVPAR